MHQHPLDQITSSRLQAIFARAGFSRAQSDWLCAKLPNADTIERLAVLAVMVHKFGPDMQPIDCSDADLTRETLALLDACTLLAWDTTKEVRQ